MDFVTKNAQWQRYLKHKEEKMMKEKTFFKVDEDKCIGCGMCTKVCPGEIINLDEKGKPVMKDFEEYGWNGCWKCEHCLAVCPKGAISIFNHNPEKSLKTIKEAEKVVDVLVANRHICRRYLDEDVDKQTIDERLTLLANAPNGGNKQQIEFTLFDNKEELKEFRKIVYERMEELASNGIYPEGFDKQSYEDMKRWQRNVRPDMLFCEAPNLLIPHAPIGKGEPVQNVIIAVTYFEILCNARELRCSMLTFPLAVLNTMPDIKGMLEIPENHYIGMILGFGYPEIKYIRGVQKEMDEKRIHRPFCKTSR